MYRCPECEHTNTPKGKALTVAMSCQKCGQYFRVHTGYHDKFLVSFTPAIPLGTKGRINNVLYEVMGFAVKRERKYRYSWREYLLFNPEHGIAFLSEADGNWNFLKPYPKHPWSVSQTSEEPRIDKGKFALYAKYRAELLFASGEFFFDVIEVTEKTHHYEHINPPYILNFEEGNTRLGAYLGEYISPDKVAAAFKLTKNKLPKKEHMGYTEPIAFSFDPASLFKITALTLLLATLFQIFFVNTAANKFIVSQDYNQADLGDQKMFSTKSFELTGGMKDVMVQVTAPISNDWFFAEYSLINETTGDELIFSKEIEYYSGTESGESWSEGANVGEAFLSSIPEGKYHINIYPEFSLTNHQFSIAIHRDVNFYSNYIILLLLLLIFPIVIYFYWRSKEVKRWADSDYSPYITE
jgi:Domain of unknown function (DUF4178)